MGFDVHDCEGKRRYKSKYEARKIANRAERYRGRELRVYLCEKCWGFHITSEWYKDNKYRK